MREDRLRQNNENDDAMENALNQLSNSYLNDEGREPLQNSLKKYYRSARNRKSFSREVKRSNEIINVPIISKSKIKIMFVSSRNICRSAMAEFVMKYLINSAGLSEKVLINSSGCNVDPEFSMDQGAIKELHRHQIPFIKKNAVQFNTTDFENYDYIICMNYGQIKLLNSDRSHKNIFLLSNFFGENRNISDPIPSNGYSSTYGIIYRGCESILNHLKKCFANDSTLNKNSVETKITLSIDEDLFKKFETALVMKKDNLETAIEKCLNYYISDTVSIEDFILKCANRIEQINYRIIKSYFKAIEIDGKATSERMKFLCSNLKEYPGLYIYNSNGFDEHYEKLKNENKIFFENDSEVKIVPEVVPILEKYKSQFVSRK